MLIKHLEEAVPDILFVELAGRLDFLEDNGCRNLWPAMVCVCTRGASQTLRFDTALIIPQPPPLPVAAGC